MVSRYIIYGLTDPRTDEVRYIGRSSSGLGRPRRHLRESAFDDHKSRWIKSLIALDLKYGIVVLESCPSASALSEAEQRWIAHGRVLGWRLTNVLVGGDAGRTGLTTSPETRAKQSAAAKGRPKSPEHRAAMSRARLGVRSTEETRAKQSASQKARIAANPLERERLRTLRLGAVNSATAREKLRAANLGLKHSPERCAINARAQTGRKRSPESRAKQAATMRAIWAARRERRGPPAR